MIAIAGVSKDFVKGERRVLALQDIDLAVAPREFVAILGPSGCGKSTLLNLIGALDRPTRGDVVAAGVSLGALDDEGLTRYRRRTVGIVFQFFNLLPSLTVT